MSTNFLALCVTLNVLKIAFQTSNNKFPHCSHMEGHKKVAHFHLMEISFQQELCELRDTRKSNRFLIPLAIYREVFALFLLLFCAQLELNNSFTRNIPGLQLK